MLTHGSHVDGWLTVKDPKHILVVITNEVSEMRGHLSVNLRAAIYGFVHYVVEKPVKAVISEDWEAGVAVF